MMLADGQLQSVSVVQHPSLANLGLNLSWEILASGEEEMMRLAATCSLGPCRSPNITNADRARPSRKNPPVQKAVGMNLIDGNPHAKTHMERGGIPPRDTYFERDKA